MKVLIANRGEIACRIARTLRSLGVPSVAVFSPSDRIAPHVWLADEAVPLATEACHTNFVALIAAAKKTSATHVHPGYGFVSQNPAFVRACVAAGLIFIGPCAAAMAQLGDKALARALAEKIGVPCIPGGALVRCAADVAEMGKKLGYPLLIKATAGGGGRGMRQVASADDVTAAYESAKREADQLYIGSDLLAERLLWPARHIEVQVLADGQHARALGDRECSLQRRYQKVVEEGPAAAVSPQTRAAMAECAVALVEAANFCGACTVEFLSASDGAFFFLEVNPRLQVEHPITEMCCNIDLVALQLAVSCGSQVAQLDLPPARGHAIEVRLNAEDPAQQFAPQTGEIMLADWPQGPHIRVDAGVAQGSLVSPHFDPLLAKVIAWGVTREQARLRLIAALDEVFVLGVQHNLAFLRATLTKKAVIAAETYTHTLTEQPYIPQEIPPWLAAQAETLAGEIHGPCAPGASASPWSYNDAFGTRL